MELEEFKPSMQELRSSKDGIENDDVAMEVDEIKPNIQDLKNTKDGIKNETGSVPESSNECPSSQYFTPSQAEYFHNGTDCLPLQKEAVVVLTRLPEHIISALQSPTAQEVYSETESWGDVESDTLWEPGEDSDDSDIPHSYNNRKATKMKKSSTSEKPIQAPIQVTIQAPIQVTIQAPIQVTIQTPIQAPIQAPIQVPIQAPSSNNTSTEGVKVEEPRPSVQEPQSSKDSIENNNVSAAAKAGCSVISTYMGFSKEETKNVRPNLPEKEVLPGMMVIARRRAMEWKRGKLAEINTKEDGRLKYKVIFEEKGKSLVSGHHIAFDSTARLVELYIGARVVVQSLEDELSYLPGVLGELPSRKNRLRFLVFIDDHTPVYVGLPLLHLVCRPLENSLDDVPSGIHKYFLTQYLKRWPYPHLTRYRVGQTITVDVNGVPEKCEVQSVDCSLILVVYQHNQTREWIHRGSIRLEHIFKLLKMDEQSKLTTEVIPRTGS